MTDSGFDTLHTLDLSLKNRTPDTAINQLSIEEQRVVITKDADFVNSFLLQERPWKLLLISTGNIRNSDLEVLFRSNIKELAAAFDSGAAFVELTRTSLIFHI
jgi:predicted nuclease of predicted toxin-antitoxin system